MRLAGVLAFGLLALAAAGCGGKFSLPTETPGGVIPEKGSYAYTGSVRGLPHLTDVLLTRGTGSTVYVVFDSANVRAFPRFFRGDGSTPPLSYVFAGTFKPIRIAQGPNRLFVLDAGDTTLALTDTTLAPGFLVYGLTGGAPTFVLKDTSLAQVSGIAGDAAGNVYVAGVAREFIRDDPQDSRRRTFKFVSRVYRYLAAQGYARDIHFYVDDGQGIGTISNPGDIYVDPILGDGYLYIADTGKDVVQRMLIQDNEGEPLPSIALDGSQSGTTFTFPTDFVADNLGFMYAVDTGNRRILRYDAGGAYIQKVNIELDLDADSLHVPIATSVDDSLVYVADYQTGKVASYKRRK
jgi:sugar lactone lactonase YvrE